MTVCPQNDSLPVDGVGPVDVVPSLESPARPIQRQIWDVEPLGLTIEVKRSSRLMLVFRNRFAVDNAVAASAGVRAFARLPLRP